MGISEKTLGVSNERWWLVARLFAALSAIQYFHHIASALLDPLTIRSAIYAEQEWGAWSSYFISGFGFGWVYFVGCIIAVGYFQETWQRTAMGMVAIGVASTALFWFFPIIWEFIALYLLGLPEPEGRMLGSSWGLYGAFALQDIVPLVFLVAGGAFSALAIKSPHRPRMLSFAALILVLYLAASGLTELLIRAIDLNLSYFTQNILATLIFPRDFLAGTWSNVASYAALEAMIFAPILYLTASLFEESWQKVALTMLVAGIIATLLPELITVVVRPWYLEAGYSAVGAGDLEHDYSTVRAEYFMNSALPNIVLYILVLSAGLPAIALRHYLPPDQLRPMMQRIRRWN